jgi:type II secretory pathway pseudopilin PulG
MKTNIPAPQACGAFTLLELILVMSVMVLVLGVGVGSFAYFDQVDPLEEPAQQLGQMSKYAMNTAVIQHRSMTIAFDKENFGVVGASAGGMGNYSHGKSIKVFIKRWGGKGWEKAEGQIWRFGEQGICEPITVRFEEAQSGFREVKFHALTGGVTE